MQTKDEKTCTPPVQQPPDPEPPPKEGCSNKKDRGTLGRDHMRMYESAQEGLDRSWSRY